MTKSIKFFAATGIVAGLGVACALPSAIHAETTTSDTIIKAKIAESASIVIDVPEIDDDLATGGDPAQIGDAGNITVATNSPNGYTLSVKGTGDAGYETDLHSQVASSTEKIAYGTPAKNTSAWGMYIDSSLFALTAADKTIEATTGPTTGVGKAYAVAYKASASPSQAQGTYQGQVTFTVKTN